MILMKTQPVRRLFLAYTVLFASLFGIILIQFTSNTSFTHYAGSMIVTGHYTREKTWQESGSSEERGISGPLSITFGGLEFDFNDELVRTVNNSTSIDTCRPISFLKDFETLRIRLSDNSFITLKTVYTAGKEVLRISALFSDDTQDITIPFDARLDALIKADGNGQFTIETKGQVYLFTDSVISLKERSIRLSRRSPVANYGMLQAHARISPVDLVPEAYKNRERNSAKINAWIQQAFRIWERDMAETTNEDTILAYILESQLRGNFHAAVATVPKAFVDSGNMTKQTSPYLGRLEQTLDELESQESSRTNEILRLLRDKNADILLQERLVTYLRDKLPVILNEDIPDLIRTMDVSSIDPSMAIGILECWAEFARYWPKESNPFERLIDQSEYLVSRLVRTLENQLFLPVINQYIDTSTALRLVRVLTLYARESKDEHWQLLADSVFLSLIALADDNLGIPSGISVDQDNTLSTRKGSIPASRLYLALEHPVSVPTTINIPGWKGTTLSVWSALPDVQSTETGRFMDLRFPTTQDHTHYVLIRGVDAFSSLFINNEKVTGSIRFERNESSGWYYIPSRKALLLKLKANSPGTRVQIVYIEARPVAPDPVPAPASENTQTDSPQEQSVETDEAAPDTTEDTLQARPSIPLQWRSIPRAPRPLP